MKIATPAFDRLSAEVKAQFLSRITEAAFRRHMSTGHEHILSASAANHLLHAVDNIQAGKKSALRQARVSEDVARELLEFVEDVKWAIRGLTARQMKAYTDTEIGAVLVDFFHIDYEEFDPYNPDNALDYNADDDLPKACETPHNHLSDLVQDAVVARLIKRDGQELMLAWVNAQSSQQMN